METKKAIIPVKGMTCVNCAAAIQKDISKLAGVQSANVNYANEKAVIEFDPAVVGLEQFISSIHESGYQAITEKVFIPIIDLDVSRSQELERIAGEIDGVLKTVVNPAAGTAELEYIPGQIGLRDIRRAIEKAGFRVRGMKMTRLSRQQAEAFYEIHRERPFFTGLVAFMTEGPVVVLVLEREDAIKHWREVMGATNPAQAAEGTIRKKFAKNIERNAVHGSDAPETAGVEIPFFFNMADLL